MNLDPMLVALRKPEPRDLPALLSQKNDPEVKALLGGFSNPLALRDLEDWLEFHRKRSDEVLWTIAAVDDDRCLGHIGLYKIDPVSRSAELGIMIGAKEAWGRGVGRSVTRQAVRYAFDVLNLRRISLTVLSTNERAIRLYRALGFVEEGRLREAVYRQEGYIDLLAMGLLREEFVDA